MKEVLTLHVGHCGNAIGMEFWEMLCLDHGLDNTGNYTGDREDQLQLISTFFHEKKSKVYTPRALMIDLDESSLETVKNATYGNIFKDENFLHGGMGTGKNWAKGHFSEGGDLCNRTLNAVRKEIETCDSFHGFQITHSIGGGTGGGLGSLILQKLKEEYPLNIISTYSVVPSSKVLCSVVEPYNAILTFNHMIENSHETFCIDNEALYTLATDKLKSKDTSLGDLNQIVASAMSGITTCMRFSSSSNISLGKMLMNLVPCPRMHFFIPNFSPIVKKNYAEKQQFTMHEIVESLFNYKNLFSSFDPKRGKFLAVACVFRGEVNSKDIEKHLSNIQNKDSTYNTKWIPDNIKTSICTVPPPYLNRTGTFVGNTTSIKILAKNIKEKYKSMIKKKAFLHSFTAEGMEEKEFHVAESNLNELIAEYQQYETPTSNTNTPNLNHNLSKVF